MERRNGRRKNEINNKEIKKKYTTIITTKTVIVIEIIKWELGGTGE